MPTLLAEPTDPPLLSDVTADSALDRVCLIREVERREKRNGAPYLRMTVDDQSCVLPAILWRSETDGEPTVAAGTVIRIGGHLTEHPRYGRQIIVSTLEEPAADEVDWRSLVGGPAHPVSTLVRDLDALLESLADPRLARLMRRLLGPETPLGDAYRHAPAAKYNHHAYPHGLLEHSLQVARLVDAAAGTFPELDRDLAICGALLHDIGKLDAYESSGPAADLTDRGKLEGEIPMGYYRVRRAIEEHGDVPPEGERLLHVILAHHGRLEHGSPVMPSTREAAVVHAMDALSGTLGAFDRLERETSADQSWSRFDRVLESSAYFGQR